MRLPQLIFAPAAVVLAVLRSRSLVGIERNLDLARSLRIAATPTFIINDSILRGAADLQAFQSVIAEARGQ